MSAPVNVRAMGWYSKWRSIVFQKVNECFETFDADVVELREGAKILEDQLRLMDGKYIELRTTPRASFVLP